MVNAIVLVVAFLSWNATGTIDWGTGGAVAAIAGTIKMVLYVYHDKAYARFWNANETKTEAVNSPRKLDTLFGMGLMANVVRDANDPLNGEFYVITD